MPPPARRYPVWSNGEVLDLISVWGEEAVQFQQRSSHRNYDIFGQISRDMLERGHDRDTLQCRVKVKEQQNAYRKAREANSHSSAALSTIQRCGEPGAFSSKKEVTQSQQMVLGEGQTAEEVPAAPQTEGIKAGAKMNGSRLPVTAENLVRHWYAWEELSRGPAG
ncbi:hypothetical protein UY3_18088 [Chelonia mydas]|uniref:Myb/SANT-like DNA-binding domain-containing protein n=1 Tax=Chelonia mydas TaxID=8469 RepID=M7AIM2_CHEMY|nr:hypothetical protein UY3_18088 [Chelonia mydas]